MSIKLSVVIVNYNTREDLRACLIALHDCRPMPEVIVVDNASKDGSAEMVDAEFPRVVLLTPGRNTWYCGGNNLGIAAAHGKYVLLLNPDTQPPNGALARMVEFMESNPTYAGVTAQLRYPDGRIQRTCSRVPSYHYLLLTQTPLKWILSNAHKKAEAYHWYAEWDRTTDYDVEVIPGSCMMLRHEDLTLDDDLLLYFPEETLAQRIGTNMGRKFRYLADPHIIHREKSATGSVFATRIYFRDMLVYARKHHGAARAALLWALSRPLLWGIELRAKMKNRKQASG
jgi:GT2 family glycosyltransferase